jgi:hypothetical protein
MTIAHPSLFPINDPGADWPLLTIRQLPRGSFFEMRGFFLRKRGILKIFSENLKLFESDLRLF